jgi:mono/diheme cytochrome c family protein
MTSDIIIVFAVVAGIAWLGVVFVSAIRNRGREEVAPNLRPGTSDQEMETKRLETGQKAAIAFSAFMAISLPLYFLGEPDRQAGFEEQFDHESVERGEHLVEEFACFSCHGPDGVGGTALFVEKRSGVTVSWTAPSLNDVLYRYDEEEVNFWITYGRGNTPMPAWGLPGGGPLNEAQVLDVVTYLETIQIPQSEAVNETPDPVRLELDKLANAESTLATAILNQAQVVEDIMAAETDADFIEPIARRAREVLDAADSGIDTDGDAVSDAAETELSELSSEALAGFTVVDPVVMDPETADAELADEAETALAGAVDSDPLLTTNLLALQTAVDEGSVPAGGISSAAAEDLDAIAENAADAGISVPAGPYDTVASAQALAAALSEAAAAEDAPEEAATLAENATAAVDNGSDPDGDGLSTGAENEITTIMADASTKTVPSQLAVIVLDPANSQSVGGQADLRTATSFVGGVESLATSLRVTSNNQETVLAAEDAGLVFLEAAAEERAYEIDIAGVAAAMGVSEDEAARAVGLFNANCARCHTSGFSAGLPFTQEAGSGGFGPALWDGRPVVQFGEAQADPADDLLIQFLIRGSESETPYGLNGFGSGRMPAFGAILPAEDIALLAAYLRSGDLDGRGE